MNVINQHYEIIMNIINRDYLLYLVQQDYSLLHEVELDQGLSKKYKRKIYS
jgi:hypothetical protein